MEDGKKQPNKFFNLFTVLNIIIFLLALFSCFYFLYIRRDFNFIVETSCDTSKEQCVLRDCSNPDDCPPNGLSVFKRYSLNAKDFKYCKNEDCLLACEDKQIICTLVPCEESSEFGESCSDVVISQENQVIYE